MRIVPGKKEQRRLEKNEKSISKWTGIDVRFLVLGSMGE